MAERAMLLCKARCIHDAAQPSARRPPALQHRTTALPSVTVQDVAAEGEEEEKRTREAQGCTVAAVVTSTIQVQIFCKGGVVCSRHQATL